jgi:hypothetical protein
MTSSSTPSLRTDSAATMPSTRMTSAIIRKDLARIVIVAIPVLALAAAVTAELAWLALLLAAGFIGAAAIVCGRAAMTFTGETLRLLVSARVVIVVVLAAVLLATNGIAHTAIGSAALSWFARIACSAGEPCMTCGS